jgi:hypothetical protein
MALGNCAIKKSDIESRGRALHRMCARGRKTIRPLQ